MSKLEYNGSLLRKFDPEFEAMWDRIYEETMQAMAVRDEAVKQVTEEQVVTQEVGSKSVGASVLVVPVQEELF